MHGVACIMSLVKLHKFINARAKFTRIDFPKFYSSSSKDIFDILEEKVEEDIDYDVWLKNTKKAMENSKGKFWLGKSSVNYSC